MPRPRLPRTPFVDLPRLEAAGYDYYFLPIEAHLEQGRVRLADGREMLMLGGYSYHGLGRDPRVVAAAQAATSQLGTNSHGARALAGTTTAHRAFEERWAAFLGVEDALTFASGYVANLAALGALVGPGDVVLSDRLNHASLLDGVRFSGAAQRTYHRPTAATLTRKLRSAPEGAAVLLVTDAVFSMDGSIADLPALIAFARSAGASIFLDECHSMLILGATGRGLCEHQGVDPAEVLVHMGTLNKALPAAGGYIAGSRELCRFLAVEARGFLYSAAIPPASAAAALAGLTILEEEPWHFAELSRKADLFRLRLRSHGLDCGRSETPIVPVILGPPGVALETARRCQAAGLFVHPIVPPVVPPGSARLRCTVMSTHRDEDLARAADTIAEIVEGLRPEAERYAGIDPYRRAG
jgi:8-amino-7-oxononanoate synthase